MAAAAHAAAVVVAIITAVGGVDVVGFRGTKHAHNGML